MGPKKAPSTTLAFMSSGSKIETEQHWSATLLLARLVVVTGSVIKRCYVS